MQLMNPSTRLPFTLMVGTCSQLLAIQLSKSGISVKAIFSTVCMDMKELLRPVISLLEETFSHLLAAMQWSWYGKATWMKSRLKTLMKRQELRPLHPRIHVLELLQILKHQDQLHIEQKVQVVLRHLAAKKFKLQFQQKCPQQRATTKVKFVATPHRWVHRRALLLVTRLTTQTSNLLEDKRIQDIKVQVVVSPDPVKNLHLLSRKWSPNLTSSHEPCMFLSSVCRWMKKVSRIASATSTKISSSVSQGHTNLSSSRYTIRHKHSKNKWCSHANLSSSSKCATTWKS